MTARRHFGSLRQLPSGRWQVRYRDGSGERVSHPETFRRKTDAARALATIEADLIRGALLDGRAGDVTTALWAERWLATKRGQRANTLARDRAALAYALPVVGEMRIASVKRGDIERIVDVMVDNDLSAKSIRTYLGTIAALFSAAVDADLVLRSPVRTRALNLGTPQRPERPTLTPDELLRLAREVPPRHALLVLLAGVLGLRWGEAIALRVRDVDTQHHTVSVNQTVEEIAGEVRIVPFTKSKAGRRTMTVPAFLLTHIEEHIVTYCTTTSPDELLFRGARGGLLRRAFLRRTFKPAAARAGLPESLTFHGLRHVATSLMVATGEHPRVIQARLGHADPALSMALYAHVPDEADRAAARRLGELFVTTS